MTQRIVHVAHISHVERVSRTVVFGVLVDTHPKLGHPGKKELIRDTPPSSVRCAVMLRLDLNQISVGNVLAVIDNA